MRAVVQLWRPTILWIERQTDRRKKKKDRQIECPFVNQKWDRNNLFKGSFEVQSLIPVHHSSVQNYSPADWVCRRLHIFIVAAVKHMPCENKNPHFRTFLK